MALAARLGASLLPLTHERLFGEDQARYVVTCAPSAAAAISAAGGRAGIAVDRIGHVTADATLNIAGGPSISLDQLRSAHEGWFPAYMSGEL
jgi:phosphoribosylformylglycinamidine synthase